MPLAEQRASSVACLLPASPLEVHLGQIAIEATPVEAEVHIVLGQILDRFIAIFVDEVEAPQTRCRLDKIDQSPRGVFFPLCGLGPTEAFLELRPARFPSEIGLDNPKGRE